MSIKITFVYSLFLHTYQREAASKMRVSPSFTILRVAKVNIVTIRSNYCSHVLLLLFHSSPIFQIASNFSKTISNGFICDKIFFNGIYVSPIGHWMLVPLPP